MRLKISHLTKYEYDSPVHYGLQELRLTPKSRSGQRVIAWQTTVKGGKKELEFDDQHNNHVALVSVERGHGEVSILSEGEVETSENSGVIGPHGGFAPLWYFKRTTKLTRPGINIHAFAKELDENPDGDIQRMHNLSNLIAKKITYEIGRTHSGTTAEDVLEAGYGVCQDHAHVFLSVARLLGFPARYVSGYLMMNDHVDQDASHAWVEVHIDEIGWIGFDISNGISPDERYVRVATGLDYKDAAPVSGVRFGDGSESIIVTVQVQQ